MMVREFAERAHVRSHRIQCPPKRSRIADPAKRRDWFAPQRLDALAAFAVPQIERRMNRSRDADLAGYSPHFAENLLYLRRLNRVAACQHYESGPPQTRFRLPQ